MKKRVQVLVAYHRQAKVIGDEVYRPILAGAAVTAEKSKDGRLFLDEKFLSAVPFRDDVGDNISRQNRFVNEMSAVYWGWRHLTELGEPDFVGLAHYRRFFITDPELQPSRPRWFAGAEAYLYEDGKDFSAAISSDRMSEILTSADGIVPCLYTPTHDPFGHPVRSSRDCFLGSMRGGKGELYDAMERFVLETRPDFATEVAAHRTETAHYFCNMFVMPRQLFEEYCGFIFPILERLVGLNSGETDVELMRAPGFLAEYLTSIFISAAIRQNRFHPAHLRIACLGVHRDCPWRRLVRRIMPDSLRHALRKFLGRA